MKIKWIEHGNFEIFIKIILLFFNIYYKKKIV